ncbi:MAG TPA: TetR/AcrR family transcriptional regulator [Acidimicrobiales bacterium]|nr:TetR/AcrR family transcriptional regulator [Acidimicrobiales bacterium]
MSVPASSDLPDVGEPDDSGASTRDRLLWAAYELLITRGYDATTVQAVARRAGLTTGAIYANFGGKQDLMAQAVLDEWYRTERASLDQYLAVHAPGDLAALAEGVEALADAFTMLLAHHIAAPPAPEHRLLTEVTGAIIREDLSESPLLVSVRLIEQLTRTSVENGKAKGTISQDLSTDALVAVIVNVYLGAITSKSLGLPQPDLADTLQVLKAANSGYASG